MANDVSTPTTKQAIAKVARNPFVGLRPYNSDEAALFFGRQQQTEELLERLQRDHFIAVIGSSGCGKSSWIRAGLIPQLQSGFQIDGRDQWRVAALKPGDAPLRNLALALYEIQEDPSSDQLITAIQERGVKAILEHLQPTLSLTNNNLLLLIDQFEEIFRYGLESNLHGEASEFVALLLQLIEQTALPVFVILTMRSDFVGDCDNFYGLPEALNRCQYLVPRLTRQQCQQAIEGPARLNGAAFSRRLLDRLLNDIGNQVDQLPVLQHALMRTWEFWRFEEANRQRDAGQGGEDSAVLTLDWQHYEAAGTIKYALAKDAEAVLMELDDKQVQLTQRLFAALTAIDAYNRRFRRPAHLSELCQITGAQEADLCTIIERWRRNGRSFLMLSHEADPLVDISHESLIRQWPRIEEWIRVEAESAELFKRLLMAARRKHELWRGRDLSEARYWLEIQQPNPAWAWRYDGAPDALELALHFLKASEEAEAKALAIEESRRAEEILRQKRELRRTRIFAFVVSVLLLLALGLAWYAYHQTQAIKRQAESSRKQGQLTAAPDGKTLASAGGGG